MQDGMRRRRRQLSPEEKWQLFLEVSAGAHAGGRGAQVGCRVSVVIRLRRLAKDAALAAFAASRPGRVLSPEQVELEELRQENARLSEALKELAVELSLVRGRQRSGFQARSLGA